MIDIKKGIYMVMGPAKPSESHWCKAIEDELKMKKIDYTKIQDGDMMSQAKATSTASILVH